MPFDPSVSYRPERHRLTHPVAFGLHFAEAKRKAQQLATKRKAQQLATKSVVRRSIEVEWQGYSELFTTKLEIRKRFDNGDFFVFPLPDNNASCSGTYWFSSESEGNWGWFCSDGLVANGTFEGNNDKQRLSGVGTDSENRVVHFTIEGTEIQ